MSEQSTSEDVVLFGWIFGMISLAPIATGILVGLKMNSFIPIVPGLYLFCNAIACELTAFFIERFYE